MVDALKNPKIPRGTCSGSDDGGEYSDRFSSLPEPIIHHILSFMETIDVVRASVVSRKWRYLWLSIPFLNFNVHNIWKNPLERWSLQTINEKFKDFVHWVLLSQDRSISIQRFRLSCLNFADDYTLNRWISVMAQRNVEVLDLNIISDEPIKLPPCLVTCTSLVSLKLHFGLQKHRGVIKLPMCVGFSRLKSLDLKDVELLDHILFSTFISSSPLLENLNMVSCSFSDFKILDISSISLKNLTLEDYELVGSSVDELGNHKVKIACPNLVSFIFSAPSPPDITFEGLNSLQYAFIFVDDLEEHAKIKEILRGLCEVKVLKLPIALFMCQEVLAPATSFYNLKSLIIGARFNESHMPSIISMLDCSPNLEAITVFFSWEYFNESEQISVNLNSCLRYPLKTVELIDFDGYENELELVRFLLKHGHLLQKLTITWVDHSDDQNKTEVISEIMKFPRSSSSVLLRFLEPPPMSDLDLFKIFR